MASDIADLQAAVEMLNEGLGVEPYATVLRDARHTRYEDRGFLVALDDGVAFVVSNQDGSASVERL